MNDEQMTINEVLNDGSKIYFYKEDYTGTWITYGYSAYLLAHFADVKCLESYSVHMQMPCVTLSETEFKKLLIANRDSFTAEDSGYLMSVDTPVDETQYQAWVQGLR